MYLHCSQTSRITGIIQSRLELENPGERTYINGQHVLRYRPFWPPTSGQAATAIDLIHSPTSFTQLEVRKISGYWPAYPH